MRRYLLFVGLWGVLVASTMACSQTVAPEAVCDEQRSCEAGRVCVKGLCLCPLPQKACGERCVDIRVDNRNCGDCDNVCQPGRRCVKGKCACAEDRLACSGNCVDPKRDPKHCGGCENPCPRGNFCVNGVCEEKCPSDTPDPCGQACVDTNSDQQNCGKCGEACKNGQICQNGTCGCPDDKEACGDACVDIKTDRRHCGECGKTCTKQPLCVRGKCSATCPSYNPDQCAGGCYDLQNNAQHCGVCNNACSSGKRCANGTCVCPKGTEDCDGVCVNVQNNAKHCGACGKACASGNVCSGGRCFAECPRNTESVCGGACADTKTDPLHCGGCGKACAAGQVCNKGKCQCPQGFTLCQGRCINTNKNGKHCGTCNNSCAKGKLCAAGSCEASCPSATPDECLGGCVNKQEDAQHCGACGKTCPGGQICNKGQCTCPTGNTLCQGQCVDTQTNNLHCGKCQTVCSSDKSCSAGQCALSCPDQRADRCDNKCTDLKTSNAHCGKCDNVCAGQQQCDEGECKCPNKQSACGKGCFDTDTANAHCGKCDNACKAGEKCKGGACEPDCLIDETDCSGTCANLQTSLTHCGKCGETCGAGQLCEKGACTCPKGLSLCDGQCVDTDYEAKHCGACNSACTGKQRCEQGQCVLCTQGVTKTCGSSCCPTQFECCGAKGSENCVDTKHSSQHCGKCGTSCGVGQTCCNGQCQDIRNDKANCGACGRSCGASENCCNGACIDFNKDTKHCGACGNACTAGQACCNGACIDTTSDPKHCSACGKACSPGQGCCGGACTDLKTNTKNCGACGKTCGTGESCCGGTCLKLQSDPKNCGACGKVCGAGQGCCQGQCIDLTKDGKNCGQCGNTCASGSLCCAGACVNTGVSNKNCGACGKTCGSNERCCSGLCIDTRGSTSHCGACGQSCPNQALCCGSSCANVQTSTKHCGACGKVCQAGDGCCGGQCLDLKSNTKHCGACGNACKTGQQCCGGQCVDTQNSKSHCGACGKVCSGTGLCCKGQCVDPNINKANCGACGRVCGVGQGCCNGQCLVLQQDPKNCGVCGKSCTKQGEGCCGGQCLDLQNDAKNCGKCGNACKSGQGCCNGQCIDFKNDTKNCGKCGNVCATGQGCCNGACVDTKVSTAHCGACGKTCQSGESCCGGDCADTKRNTNHCGACGKTCKTGEACCGGACRDVQSNNQSCGACGKVCARYSSCDKGVCEPCPPSAKEICGNKKDDDCDGKVDEPEECNWLSIPQGLNDYDIRKGGGVFVTHPVVGSRIQNGSCYDITGKVTTATFTIATAPSALFWTSVQTAKTLGTTLVTWTQRDTTQSTISMMHYRLYDKDCKALTTAKAFPAAKGVAETRHSSAIAPDGRFVLAYKNEKKVLQLAFYNAAGLQQGNAVSVDTAQKCASGYGWRVALNGKGTGIVSCQAQWNTTMIHYRRFTIDSGGRFVKFIEPTMVPLTESNKANSYYQSHAVAINDNGVYIFHWQAYYHRTLYAASFDANAKRLFFGPAAESKGHIYSGFNNAHPGILRIGNDFLLRDTHTLTRDHNFGVYRHTASGKLVAAATGPWDYRYVRYGEGRTYAYDSSLRRIYPFTLKLTANSGICAGGKACFCQPYSKRECRNSSSSRAPCRSGHAYCKPDGSDWGECVGQVTPKPELCGNQIDDDCDGKTDESCPLPANTRNTTTASISFDFDVAADGTQVQVVQTGRGLQVQCYDPSGQLTQQRWLTKKGRGGIYPAVKMARRSKYFVVVWRDMPSYPNHGSDNKLKARLFDNRCRPVGKVIEWGYYGNYVYNDFAIGGQGNFALASYDIKVQTTLRLFDNKAQEIGAPRILDTGSRCRYQIRVAMNPNSGDGVLTCQNTHDTPVYYRRFKASGALEGTALTAVPHTSRRMGYYSSHITGMNSRGDFAVMWQHYYSHQIEFVVLDNGNRELGYDAKVSAQSGTGYHNYNDYFLSRMTLMGDDFIFREASYRATKYVRWFRYNRFAKPVSSDGGIYNNYRNWMRSSDRDTYLYISDQGQLRKNPINLRTSQGLCAGRPCMCRPGAKEVCNEGHDPITGSCKTGIRTCLSSAMAWSACVGTVAPVPEVCGNSKDDDCDGKTDENCSLKSIIDLPPVFDSRYGSHDVADDGSMVVVRRTGNGLVGTCFNPNGTVKRGHFLISQLGRGALHNTVHYAKKTKRFVVAWRDIPQPRAHPHSARWVARLYDSNCQPLKNSTTSPASNEIVLTTEQTKHRGYWNQGHIAIGGPGNFAFVHVDNTLKLKIKFFDALGRQLGSTQGLDTKNRCHYAYAMRLALSDNGDGVVTCQRDANQSIFYRRFRANGTFLDSDLVAVPSTLRNSSNDRTHVVGYNTAGDWAVVWQSRSKHEMQAAFFKAGTSLSSPKIISYSQQAGFGYNGFAGFRVSIERMGTDFVFRDAGFRNEAIVRWYRYSRDGVLKASSGGPYYLDRNSLRTGSNKTVLSVFGSRGGNNLYRSWQLRPNAINLTSGSHTFCGGKPCLCTPGTTQVCTTGSTYPRSPCKTGTRTCLSNGQDWSPCTGEIPPVAEICGNKKDDDCDGQVDECGSANQSLDVPPYTNVNLVDYDVADDGNVALIRWTGHALRGSCYKPDGSSRNIDFLINRAHRGALYPFIRMNKKTKSFVVMWRDTRAPTAANTSGRWVARIYNANCQPLGKSFAVDSHPVEWISNFRFTLGPNNVLYTAYINTSSQLVMQRYSATGSKLGGPVIADNKKLCRLQYGIQIAVNHKTGDGVLTCQHSDGQPLYYRRFRAAGTLVGSGMTALPVTVAPPYRSSHTRSHVVAVNSQDDIALMWVNRYQHRVDAAILDRNNTLIKYWTVTSIAGSGRSGLQDPRHRIELMGDDFVMRGIPYFATDFFRWFRYDRKGNLRSANGNTYYDRFTWFRTSSTKTYILDSQRSLNVSYWQHGKVKFNDIDLTVGKGLCGRKACACKPGITQPCSPAGAKPRTPCKAGTRTCLSNGSWGACTGISPAAEICNNRKDDDCDGKTDENCSSNNTIDLPLRQAEAGINNHYDYDVANDGSIVTVNSTGTAIIASCWRANRTQLKGQLIVSEPFNRTETKTPTVKYSKVSKHFLVVWRQRMHSQSIFWALHARLYDANCNPVIDPFVWPNNHLESSYDYALDDNGNFVLVYHDGKNEVKLSFFNNRGQQLGSELSVEDSNQKLCRDRRYPARIAMNPSNGKGVVVCQNSSSELPYLRLFSFATRKMLGTGLKKISTPTTARTSYDYSYVVGMNRNSNNEYVVMWQDLNRKFWANFYNAIGSATEGKLVKSVEVSLVMSSKLNAFLFPRAGIETFGNDFILRDGGNDGTAYTWYRYRANGTLRSKVSRPTTNYLRWTLRASNTKLHVIDNSANVIRIGAITLP